jgi:hypothetical protein
VRSTTTAVAKTELDEGAKLLGEKARAAVLAGEEAKKPRRKRKQKPKRTAPGTQKGSDEAKKKAAFVLDVLAGARTPTQAAEALGVSAMRYYILESRALQGLLGACEPRPKGPPVSPEKRLAKLTRQVEKLRSEVTRYQALARATQRTVGVPPPKTPKRLKTKGGDAKGRKRRRRRPSVRALKAAAGFRKSTAPTSDAATADAAASVTPAVKLV